MSKHFSLQPLVHLARQKHDAAIKKLGLLNHNQQTAQGKLDMLQQYRKDYQAKMHEAEKGGMTLEDLRNYQDFIYRLDDAIKQQTAVVAQAQVSVQNGRGELTETQRRMKSFDTLAQRHSETERKLEAKIEQKMQDEHNGRRAAYHNTAHSEEN
ncbi:MAG: flagellar export protein FliJ [Gallionellales bacterium 35-53-114]|jgi:flagellar FliJ protein|nr:MAG: flagellar export protein FliJ [Gallionellales bacterium 35-53-114]OYZ64211.1 MAG: flagellar export protein FliJ [Gallionellales bacterium 24-53-125]OZB10479.1 MAG: flagellar export protein FliJ [Gallionellales bacterium 39-52-133]HQS57098.1 flagellar export protein FliJ [Gallionellaceae bacterium]HQS74714.1 flagellar export protein FliJ [Gallionellaceae bacterium]